MSCEGGRVVNRYKEAFDVYIGRGSKWGNPYSHKEGTKARFLVKDRGSAVAAYRAYLYNLIRLGEVTLDDLIALDGKVLGCYCKPQACHGDVILSAITWAKRKKEETHD